MDPGDYLRASNGSGDAVMAVVTTPREIEAKTIIVNSVLNWPPRGIATSFSIDPETEEADPETVTVFYYHLDGSIIVIDSFAPGYTDMGNSVGQVVVIKPTTAWTD